MLTNCYTDEMISYPMIFNISKRRFILNFTRTHIKYLFRNRIDRHELDIIVITMSCDAAYEISRFPVFRSLLLNVIHPLLTIVFHISNLFGTFHESWHYVSDDLIKDRIVNEDMKFNDNDISSKKIKNLELDILTNIYFYTNRWTRFIIRCTNDFALRDILYRVPYEEYCINCKRYFFQIIL